MKDFVQASLSHASALLDVPPGTGPLAAYDHGVAAGVLHPDPEQRRGAVRLDVLWRALGAYAPPPSARAGVLGGLRARFAKPAVKPHGVYIVGQVGRGKSMLMDLFFALTPTAHKRRVHFHAFMQETHKRLHAMKIADPSLHDPIPPLARAIAADAWLLCFDEFQVNDITDAMILGRLFAFLFAQGVIIVATSNTRPGDLFQNRPGADAFKPFIAILQRELDTIELDSLHDYRRGREEGARSWIVPPDARAEAELDRVFARFSLGQPVHAEALEVMGRRLVVPVAAGDVARFDFAPLCDRALGPGDYLALARRFPVLIIDGIPRLGPENFDVARRFITLVDALYEQKVKLYASAQDIPDRLYEHGEGAGAFERTASRLEEMRGAEWAAQPHLS
jgi:cell division protein ZapE